MPHAMVSGQFVQEVKFCLVPPSVFQLVLRQGAGNAAGRGVKQRMWAVLPRSCMSQKTEGRTNSTFPLKPPAPGALLVLGEWTYFSEVQKRENTVFYLVSYFSPCMFLWHSKAIWQAWVRNIWNYLNFYRYFSFCTDLVKKVIKVMLYK